MKDPIIPPGDARTVRPGEVVTYTTTPIVTGKVTINIEPEKLSDEVDVHVAKLNMLAAEIETEVARGTYLWNRTSRGGQPLTSAQIASIHKALARIRKAVE